MLKVMEVEHVLSYTRFGTQHFPAASELLQVHSLCPFHSHSVHSRADAGKCFAGGFCAAVSHVWDMLAFPADSLVLPAQLLAAQREVTSPVSIAQRPL